MERRNLYNKAKRLGYNGVVKYPAGTLEYWREKVRELEPQAEIIREINPEEMTINNLISYLEDLDYMNEKYVIQMFGNADDQEPTQTYTINQDFLLDTQTAETEEINQVEGSGTNLVYKIRNNQIALIKIGKMQAPNRNNVQGEFFPYYHDLKEDLTKYQIYRNETELIKYYNESCFIHSLIESNVLSINEIISLKITFPTASFPLSGIKKVCEIYNLFIEVQTIDHLRKFGAKKEGTRYIRLGLLNNHFFIIDNKEIFNKIKNINHIKIDFTTNLLNKLLQNEKGLDIDNLEYDEKTDIKQYEFKLKKNDDFTNIYFDFETYTNEEGRLVPFMVCYTLGGENIKTRVKQGDTEDFIKLFLSDIAKRFKKVRLIAHNITFDYSFILKYFTTHINETTLNGNLISGTYLYGKSVFKLKDSYNMISTKLSAFKGMFNLEAKKELINYNIYTEKTFKQRKIELSKFIEPFSEDEQEEIKRNATAWNCLNNEYIDIIKYCAMYCVADVKILKKGYEIFNSWFNEAFDLNINNFSTMASMAYYYMGREGCFDGVYQIGGKVQRFFQKCIVGGRCMTSNNKKYLVENNELLDFDAVSLYPSAMYMMGGVPIGKPKVFNGEPPKCDYYVCRCKVKKININRSFPILSYYEDGIRKFTNDISEDKILYLDMITIEDATKFQEVEFEFIDGYYFDEGNNNRISEVIKYMFEQRKQKKREKNPIQNVYKLMMNAAYGKTILKPSEVEIVYKRGLKNMNTYTYNNYQKVVNITNIGNDIYRIKCIPQINQHFNIPQCGIKILSYSKRLMNNVMCRCEDNDIMIYYQDTDSMHITKEGYEKLLKIYPEIIGEDMGQFHSDFELRGATKNLRAVKSIFLGKKAYIDILEGEDNNGNIIRGEHIRMKGCGDEVIKYEAKKLGITPYELYEKLYNNESITVDLTKGGDLLKLSKMDNMEMFKRNYFNRDLDFSGSNRNKEIKKIQSNETKKIFNNLAQGF